MLHDVDRWNAGGNVTLNTIQTTYLHNALFEKYCWVRLKQHILLNKGPYFTAVIYLVCIALGTGAVWPDKNRQMSIKVAQIWFHLKNEWFGHLYKNADGLGKIIDATGFECLPKKQKIAQSGHTVQVYVDIFFR